MKKLLFSILVLLPLYVSGCSTCMTCGTLQVDSQVRESLQAKEVNPSYNYYIFGKARWAPEVLIGIDQKYTLQSTLWSPVSNPSFQIPSLVDRINSPIYRNKQFYRPWVGYNILGPQGEKLGEWYGSKKYVRGKIDLQANNVLVMYPPKQSPLFSGPSDDNNEDDN